jgi:hypothetical protein
MTHDIERQLMQGMRERVAEVSLTGDIVGGALRRTRRKRLLFQGMTAVVLAGGLAVGAGVVADGEKVQPAPQPQPVTLASVAEASESVSYKLKVTTKPKDHNLTMVVTGAYDPAAKSGYAAMSKLNDGQVNQILVNGVLYLRNPDDTWVMIKGPDRRLRFGVRLVDSSIADSADPQDLLELLRRNQAKVTEAGPAAYRFEATVSRETPKGLMTLDFAGEAKANGDKRLSTISYRCTITMKPQGSDNVFTDTHDTVIEFSDYGVPVRVEPPAKVTERAG